MTMQDTATLPPQAIETDTHAAPKDDTRTVWIGLGVFAAVVAAAVVTWGLVGLAMTALALVPVCYVMLIVLSVGK